MQRKFAISAAVVLAVVAAIMIVLIATRDDVWWAGLAVVIFASVPAIVSYQQTKARTTANTHGLGVFDGARMREIAWSQVDAVGAHTERDDIVAMRHTNGKDIVLPGVLGSDVAELRRMLKEHR